MKNDPTGLDYVGEVPDTYDTEKWKALEPIGELGIRVNVRAGQTANASFEACVPCRPKRLTVDANCAPYFRIYSMQIGRVECLFGSEGIPASCFSSALCCECSDKKVGRMVGAAWPMLRAGMTGLVQVQNTSNEDRWFEAAFDVLDLTAKPKVM